jgi:hypothetical protein
MRLYTHSHRFYPKASEHNGCRAALVAQQGQEQMPGADGGVAKAMSLPVCRCQCLDG